VCVCSHTIIKHNTPYRYNEERALPRRLQDAREALQREESTGDLLQNRYKNLECEYARLFTEINNNNK
jgi:hypothetical protein